VPIFTSILGFLILRDSISKAEVLCLFLALLGVYIIISSQPERKSETESEIEVWPLILCMLGPMLLATTKICLRQMRVLHEFTTSTYSVIFSFTVFGFYLPLTGTPITAFSVFSCLENYLLVFISIAGGIAMILKTKAFQHEKAGRLMMLSYLSIIFTFLFDLVLIGTRFTAEEI